MAKPSASSSNSSGLKVMLVLLALSLAFYIVGPSLYWELTDSIAAAKHSSPCSPCLCDCTAEDSVDPMSECAKLDAALQDIDRIKLQEIHEELKLQKTINEERQLSSDNAYLEVKKLTSQYQKEAEKCNVGMETSEEAREKAETLLTLESQKTKLWEYRARQLGWLDVRYNDIQSEEVLTPKLVELGRAGDTYAKSEAITSRKSEEENKDNQ